MPTIGTGELILILAIVTLLFGASQLPRLARSLGQARSAFRDAVGDED